MQTNGMNHTYGRPAGSARRRGARAASGAVVLLAATALVAGCTAGDPEGDPTPTESAADPTSAAPTSASPTSEAPDAGDEVTRDDLLDTSGWEEFSNDFITFSYPADWSVDDEGNGSAMVRDADGADVAFFMLQAFEGDADTPYTVDSVQELGRLGVQTQAAEEQVLLTSLSEPGENSYEPVRQLHIDLLEPGQVDPWLADEPQNTLGYKQGDDEWGIFSSSRDVLRLDGETITDPSDEQVDEFLASERYLQILTMMDSVS